MAFVSEPFQGVTSGSLFLSMIAFALVLGLFLFWTFLGRGIIAAVRPAHPALRAWLLAPAVGLSTSVLSITWLSQWGKNGVAVNLFALPLFLGLLVATLIFFLWRRPVFPWKPLSIFAGITIFSLCYTAWPFFQFGLNWISYGNDDMANYCLGAARTLDNGFYRVPTLEELNGTDYAQFYWFSSVGKLFRFGSEILLSWVAALTRNNPLAIFMPTIMALALVQIWALGSLVLWLGRNRRLAYAATFLLAASPLFVLGVYYQLIAQVGGLSLMLAAVTMGVDLLRQNLRAQAWRGSIILALIAACLCIFYPEVTPFTGLSLILYWMITAFRTGRWLQQIPVLLGSSLLTLVLLLENSLSYFNTLIGQSSAYISSGLFPYFVVPSGLPTFLGWVPMGTILLEPWISLLIIGAALLLVCVLYTGFRNCWKGAPWACVFVVMVVVTLFLVRSVSSSFTLFKMAMFVQPLLAVILVSLGLRLFRRRFWPALLLYACFLAWVSLTYGQASLGFNLSGFCQLPGGSRMGMALDKSQFDKPVLVASAHPSIIKLSSLYLRGVQTDYPARWVFYPFTSEGDMDSLTFFQKIHPHSAAIREGLLLSNQLVESKKKDASLDGSTFANIQQNRFAGDPIWLVEPPEYNLLNKASGSARPPEDRNSYLLKTTGEKLSNYLMFVSSLKGQHFYFGEPAYISVFQTERDYYAPREFFNAIGRFFIFQVINPSPEIWLRINMTRSLQGKGKTLLPWQAVLSGTESLPIPFVGCGSANVYVGPFHPIQKESGSFFTVDMDTKSNLFRDARAGAMKLYGSDISLDSRSIIGFARDFSVLSDKDYREIARPMKLDRFPDQLIANSGVEYSGLYEDGWMSPENFFILGPGTSKDAVRLKIYIPSYGDLSQGNTFKVRVNGGKEHVLSLKVGNSSLILPLDHPGSQTRVDVVAEKFINLPSPDTRVVAASLLSAEVGPASSFAPPSIPPIKLDNFSDQLDGSSGIEFEGLSHDGWISKKAYCILGPSKAGDKILIKGSLPKREPFLSAGNKLHIRINQGEERPYPLAPGVFSFEVPCTSNNPTTRIDFAFEQEGLLKMPDTRITAARFSSIEIIPNLPVK